jgi:LmbE family N-acetylglucosaminyl deacetylase
MANSASQRILILSPHPDDESLGCGGAIRLLAQSGALVDVLYLTRGELGGEAPEAQSSEDRRQLAEVRSAEAREACRILGVRGIDFLDGVDGGLEKQSHLAGELLRRLIAESYGRIFCPWQQEKHPDHVATFRHLVTALRHYPAPMLVWLYEVWTPLPPTVCVPIDATMSVKEDAIRAHRSQLTCLDYLSAFRGLAAYRSLMCPGSRFAEAFIATDAHTLLQYH